MRGGEERPGDAVRAGALLRRRREGGRVLQPWHRQAWRAPSVSGGLTLGARRPRRRQHLRRLPVCAARPARPGRSGAEEGTAGTAHRPALAGDREGTGARGGRKGGCVSLVPGGLGVCEEQGEPSRALAGPSAAAEVPLGRPSPRRCAWVWAQDFHFIVMTCPTYPAHKNLRE